MEWFISGNVPSLKNSKVATSKGVFHSKTVSKYLQAKGVKSYSAGRKVVEDYKTRPNLFRGEIKGFKEELQKHKKPYKIGFYFVRDTRRKFDFCNAIQIILDLLTAHGVIDDDNCDEVLPIPIIENDSCYCVDKNNAGVKLVILGYCL